MNARNQDGFNLKADEDLVCCRICYTVMRHPVLASDGYHYELKELVKYIGQKGLISPFTGEVFTSVVYDRHLKEALDMNAELHDERYPGYEKAPYINVLEGLFAKKQADTSYQSTSAHARYGIFCVFPSFSHTIQSLFRQLTCHEVDEEDVRPAI